MPLVFEKACGTGSSQLFGRLSLAFVLPVLIVIPTLFRTYRFELPYRKTEITIGRLDLPVDLGLRSFTVSSWDRATRRASTMQWWTVKEWHYCVDWSYSSSTPPPNAVIRDSRSCW